MILDVEHIDKFYNVDKGVIPFPRPSPSRQPPLALAIVMSNYSNSSHDQVTLTGPAGLTDWPSILILWIKNFTWIST